MQEEVRCGWFSSTVTAYAWGDGKVVKISSVRLDQLDLHSWHGLEPVISEYKPQSLLQFQPFQFMWLHHLLTLI